MRTLSLRARLIILTALAVTIAIAGSATASWYMVRGQLYGQVDQSLLHTPMPGDHPRRDRAPGIPGYEEDFIQQKIDNCTPTAQVDKGPPNPFRSQILLPSGKICTMGSTVLQVTPQDLKVAGTPGGAILHNGANAAGEPVRIFTRYDSRHNVALMVSAPLGETQDTLDNIAMLILLVSIAGVIMAGLAGLLIARSVLRPVDKLTATVEHIARTEDLDTVIPVEGKDEIARLSHTFNTMTTALATSRDHQKQLIADAGHELRTPLTSLRTNVDLLLRSETTGRSLPAEARTRLLTNTKAQMLELTSLVGDLLELARPQDKHRPKEIVALEEVVGHAVARARLRGPHLLIDASLEPWTVHGDPGMLERAVVNLLDNAVKFSPVGGTIEVRLRDGELTVRDQGPGIPHEELPHVFERFWRSPSARSLPGSGLGLSIVARVVGESGGAVRLEAAPGGGTVARMRLPGIAPQGAEPSRHPVS